MYATTETHGQIPNCASQPPGARLCLEASRDPHEILTRSSRDPHEILVCGVLRCACMTPWTLPVCTYYLACLLCALCETRSLDRNPWRDKAARALPRLFFPQLRREARPTCPPCLRPRAWGPSQSAASSICGWSPAPSADCRSTPSWAPLSRHAGQQALPRSLGSSANGRGQTIGTAQPSWHRAIKEPRKPSWHWATLAAGRSLPWNATTGSTSATTSATEHHLAMWARYGARACTGWIESIGPRAAPLGGRRGPLEGRPRECVADVRVEQDKRSRVEQIDVDLGLPSVGGGDLDS